MEERWLPDVGKKVGNAWLFRMNKGQMTSPGLFLKKKPDFDRVKQYGKRLTTPLFNLLSFQTHSPYSRIGIVVSKRLGKAVVRNRAKRLFRELVRNSHNVLIPGVDLIVFPRVEALSSTYAALLASWNTTLKEKSLTTLHAPHHP